MTYSRNLGSGLLPTILIETQGPQFPNCSFNSLHIYILWWEALEWFTNSGFRGEQICHLLPLRAYSPSSISSHLAMMTFCSFTQFSIETLFLIHYTFTSCFSPAMKIRFFFFLVCVPEHIWAYTFKPNVTKRHCSWPTKYFLKLSGWAQSRVTLLSFCGATVHSSEWIRDRLENITQSNLSLGVFSSANIFQWNAHWDCLSDGTSVLVVEESGFSVF